MSVSLTLEHLLTHWIRSRDRVTGSARLPDIETRVVNTLDSE